MPLASGFLMQPVEQRIHAKFAAQAQARLAQIEGLIKIGITGSFGKTSTKFALATILSEKYRTYASPGSTNTPMGLSRVINEQLEDDCEVFIAEMGSRHVGDIRELCQLVEPQYGVITSIGAAHLETFGNIATVANAKFELIESLPKDGCAFFGTGGEIDKLYARCHMRKFPQELKRETCGHTILKAGLLAAVSRLRAGKNTFAAKRSFWAGIISPTSPWPALLRQNWA